jgi:hypothetical protein
VLGRLAGELEVLLGQLPGALHRLSAAGGEKDPVQVARGVAGEALGQLDRSGMGVGPQREEGQLGGLLGGGLRQLLPPVPDLHDEQAGEPVEVAASVGVPDVTPSPRTIVGTSWASSAECRLKCIHR